MADDDAVGEAELARFAEELHRFVRGHPHHYAVLALLDIISRDAAGAPVDPAERMMVLTTLVNTLRDRRRF